MRKQTSTCLAIGFLLATVPQARAQEIVAPPVPAVPVAPAYTMPYQRGCSLKRIFQWLTYRPLPVPACCQCPRCQTIGTPPLYMYFIGEFGPRSPDLAHMTGGYAAGQVFHGPSLFEPAETAHAHAGESSFGVSRIRNALPGSPPRLQVPVRRGVTTNTFSKRQALQQVPVWDVPARQAGHEVIVPVRDVPAAATGQEAPAGQDISFHGAGASREIPVHEANDPLPTVPVPPTDN